MGRLDEIVSEQFAAWEIRGRGWQVWPYPVAPEPPFRPFFGFQLPKTDPHVDEGRKPTFLSSLFSGLEKRLNSTPPVIAQEPDAEPEPEALERDALVEFRAMLPADHDVRQEIFGAFVQQLSGCREPVAFELLGLHNRISAHFTAHPADAPLVRRQLQAYFADAVFQAGQTTLEQAWDLSKGEDVLVVEFGLGREFMFPLAASKLDPFVGIIGALAELQLGELALFQVLFQSTEHPWVESIERSVTHADGKPFFVNMPELAGAAENKIARPLYAAVVRLAVKTGSEGRTLQIARDVAASLRVFSQPQGNELIPLRNDDYPFDEHVEDMLRRQSRRSGMLLNSDELIGFVHLPSSAVRSPALLRQAGKTKAAPAVARQDGGVLLGNNIHLGDSVPVRLTTEQRVRHTHVIGASGTGKSTLLFNLIRQDMENGEGIAVLDPHGDLIERILGVVPAERIHDVVLVDPSDTEYSIGFNILNAHDDLEKGLLASDLVSVFQRLSSSWGDQMHSVLQNAIAAFLESSRGGTLADLRRFLIEPAFRAEFLKSVSDPNVLYYWQKGFAHLSGNKSLGPVLTRLEMFLAKKPISHMVSQQENRLDFGHIMDSGKIFLAKLPEGLLGKENSYLLGTLLISKFQQLAMSRQAKRIESRRDFWIYIDEFYNFITPSMAEILSGARKYRIGLTLAHHELRQLQRDSEVASAVLSHPCTRISFRLGDEDARIMSNGFSFFEARDLQNLGTGEAIARIERSDFDFNFSVPLPQEPDVTLTAQRRQEVITASREKYGTPRMQVEAALREAWAVEQPAVKVPKPAVATAPAPPPVPAVDPKPAEVPKVTDSGKEKAVETPTSKAAPARLESPAQVEKPAPAVPHESEPPRDLGRGGEQHKAIQERLQKEAHALGFSAEIEKQLNSKSNCAADLVLRRGSLAIAVEITITTTTDHEFGNVKKCLSSGFERVAVVSPSPERLKQIAAAVQAGLGAEAVAKVSYHTPDDFILEIRKLPVGAKPRPEPSSSTERVTRGFKVRRHGPALTPEERKSKEQIAHQILSEVMKQKP